MSRKTKQQTNDETTETTHDGDTHTDSGPDANGAVKQKKPRETKYHLLTHNGIGGAERYVGEYNTAKQLQRDIVVMRKFDPTKCEKLLVIKGRYVRIEGVVTI